MNGYADDHDDDRSESLPRRAGSESPLSDVNDLPTTAASQLDDQTQQDGSDDDAMQDMATSEVEEEDEVAEEQDADFDEETPPPEASNGMRHDGSSSEEEVRSGKRRSAVDDEQYMKQNPELYGLRRSVRPTVLADRIKLLTSLHRAARDLNTKWYVRSLRRIECASHTDRACRSRPVTMKTTLTTSTLAEDENVKRPPAPAQVCITSPTYSSHAYPDER